MRPATGTPYVARVPNGWLNRPETAKRPAPVAAAASRICLLGRGLSDPAPRPTAQLSTIALNQPTAGVQAAPAQGGGDRTVSPGAERPPSKPGAARVADETTRADRVVAPCRPLLDRDMFTEPASPPEDRRRAGYHPGRRQAAPHQPLRQVRRAGRRFQPAGEVHRPEPNVSDDRAGIHAGHHRPRDD
jgi:hypothetical protein